MDNRENIDLLDNLVQAYDEQMENKANANTKGTAYFFASVCIFQGMNETETKSFAKGAARVLRKLNEELFIETILDVYRYLSLECAYKEIQVKELFVLRDSLKGDN